MSNISLKGVPLDLAVHFSDSDQSSQTFAFSQNAFESFRGNKIPLKPIPEKHSDKLTPYLRKTITDVLIRSIAEKTSLVNSKEIQILAEPHLAMVEVLANSISKVQNIPIEVSIPNNISNSIQQGLYSYNRPDWLNNSILESSIRNVTVDEKFFIDLPNSNNSPLINLKIQSDYWKFINGRGLVAQLLGKDKINAFKEAIINSDNINTPITQSFNDNTHSKSSLTDWKERIKVELIDKLREVKNVTII
jgi:hypothetical protein